MNITRQFAAGVACALALTIAAPAAHAQGKPKEYVSVLTIHAHPDGALDYEAFAKKVMAAADRIGLKQRMLVYQVTGGGPAYTYMVLNYFEKWADTDELLSTPEILNRALGEVEAGKALKAGRLSIASADQAIYRYAPELSVKPKGYDPPPAMLQIYRVEVQPSKMHAWERVITRFKSVLDQAPDVPTIIRRTAVEGPGGTYITSVPYSTGAERDAFPKSADVLKKGLGEDEFRALEETRLDAITHSEAFIMKFRPDLSRIPK
jgi:hypothetical protein